MSWSSRRAILVLTAVAVLGAASVVQQAFAQRVRPIRPLPVVPPVPGKPGVPPRPEGFDLGSLTLPKDDDLKERVEAAVDRIKEKNWDKACETLQELIGRTQDVFVPITRTDPSGADATAYVSVKKEAARLIGSLPKAGRQFYEAKYGPKAVEVVKRAKLNNDWKEMGIAMTLYLYTDAGAEAASWLGTYMVDRGDFQAASRYFMLLINRAGVKELSDKTLAKAAYAFHHANDGENKKTVFEELKRRDIELKFGGEKKTVAELQSYIDRLVASTASQNASDSPIFRGRPSRNARLPGGVPFLEPTWKAQMIKTAETRRQLESAENLLKLRNLPVLATFFPVTATVSKGDKKKPLIIYRSYWGIHGVDMKTGKLEWESVSEWSLDHVLGAGPRERDSQKVNAYDSFLKTFLVSGGRPQIVFENSVLGALSADNKYVYAVEDLAVPPPPYLTGYDPRTGTPISYGTAVGNAVQHNKLQIFELSRGGALKWELGGRDDKSPLSDTYFLGPPLPMGGLVYALAEKQQELRLVCINPATGKVVRTQTLANTKDAKLAQQPMRRTQAAHLSYGEGILVIPTNAGAVFGVDMLSNSLVWAYPYREKGSTPPAPVVDHRFGRVPRPGMVVLPDGRVVPATPQTEAHWQVTAPVVVEGKVVFTAPDAKSIHCIRLRDGSPVWSQPRRDEDLYMAGVFNGKVVIVGKHKTRALSLARGDTLWDLDTGVPSGQGAASALSRGEKSDTIYYLPVKESVQSREPEVCAINVDKGIILAHTKSRKKEVPGNLLFYEGDMLSQSHTEVVAYPQFEIQLAKLDGLVRDKPDDPKLLADRGDYRLDKGDLGGAIADFRKALGQKEIASDTRAKARNKLYEALTEYLQRDFNRAEEYLNEYDALCKIDMTGATPDQRTAMQAEERRRRANFLCLVGKGREAQNRLVEAFEKYLELGQEARKGELIQVVDEPSVKAAPDVWSQGRIAAMVANTRDEKQRKALEDLITRKWKKVEETTPANLEDLRKFVSLFGSLFGVGKEARLALAERLMEDTDVSSLIEAEQQLSLLRGPQEKPEVVARAVEALARLNTRKGLLDDAAYYYRLLGEKYPKVQVSPGRTGADFLDDLETDKRFLPYLGQPSRFSIRGKARLNAEDKSGAFPQTAQIYNFTQNGEPLPFFERNRLGLNFNSHALRLEDGGTGEERWNLSVTRTQFQQIVSAQGQGHLVKFNYQTLGHLVVVQMGHMVFGVDPLNKGRVLWEKNLSSLPGSAAYPPNYTSLTVDPRDNSVQVLYSDGWTQRLGQVGPLQGGVVCLQMRDALTAVDPITGRILWTRTDVNSRSHVFGDEQNIYVVATGENNTATATRAFRAYDGVSVRVPEFATQFEKRVRMLGRNILLSETDARNAVTLRIYDVLSGKDVWRQKFGPNAVVLKSEDPRLAGVVETDGTVRVVDLATQKEVLVKDKVAVEHLAKAQAVYLVSDQDCFYLAINGPPDPNVQAAGGGLQPNLMPGSGMRSVPVNGEVYSFKRETGKVHWHDHVENQHLVLTHFDEMPMVLCTARYIARVGQGAAMTNVWKYTVLARDKRTGKLVYDEKDKVPQGTYFHSLQIDHRVGKAELTGHNFKVVFTLAHGGK